MLTRFFAAALMTTLLIVGAPCAAQTSDDTELRGEIELLKSGQEAMQKDLAEIKKLLEPLKRNLPKPFEPLEVSLDGAPIQGDEQAKVTIVEFTDYQCPFCRRHKTNTVPQLTENYIETGKLRYSIGQFPLTRIHPRASEASEAALCAGDQGKYWQVHDQIFANQKKLSSQDLIAYAEAEGLDAEAFKTCLESDKYAEKVKADLALGSKAGVRGTPSFLLGLTDPNDPSKFTATKFLRGAVAYSAFEKAIDELLTEGDKDEGAGGTE